MPKLLKIKEVIKLTRLSKTTIYQMARDGQFPKPMKLGKRSSGWFEHEIESFINDCSNRRSANSQSFNAKGDASCISK
jgi:prophage regulatory protein